MSKFSLSLSLKRPLACHLPHWTNVLWENPQRPCSSFSCLIKWRRSKNRLTDEENIKTINTAQSFFIRVFKSCGYSGLIPICHSLLTTDETISVLVVILGPSRDRDILGTPQMVTTLSRPPYKKCRRPQTMIVTSLDSAKCITRLIKKS